MPCPTVNLTRIPLICLRSRRQVANRSSRLLNWCCCPPVRCGQTTREATGQPDLNFLGARHQPPDAVTDEVRASHPACLPSPAQPNSTEPLHPQPRRAASPPFPGPLPQLAAARPQPSFCSSRLRLTEIPATPLDLNPPNQLFPHCVTRPAFLRACAQPVLGLASNPPPLSTASRRTPAIQTSNRRIAGPTAFQRLLPTLLPGARGS